MWAAVVLSSPNPTFPSTKKISKREEEQHQPNLTHKRLYHWLPYQFAQP